MIARLSLALVFLALAMTGSSVAADEKENMRRLRFGIAVGTDQEARERLEPFRQTLEAELDVLVDLYLMDTLGEVVDALAKGDIDYARLSPSAYAATSVMCACIEPLATASPDEFPARFYSVLVGRKTERPLNLEDLNGAKLGVAAAESVSGYRVPLVNLAAEGLDPRKHFGAIEQMLDPLDGLQAILDGRVDVATAWSTLAGDAERGFSAGNLNDFYLSGAKGFKELSIIWRSQPIPYNAHSVRLDLPDEFKRKLRAALLELKDKAANVYLAIEPDMPGGFQPVVHSDYRPVLRTFEAEFQDILANALQPRDYN